MAGTSPRVEWVELGNTVGAVLLDAPTVTSLTVAPHAQIHNLAAQAVNDIAARTATLVPPPTVGAYTPLPYTTAWHAFGTGVDYRLIGTDTLEIRGATAPVDLTVAPVELVAELPYEPASAPAVWLMPCLVDPFPAGSGDTVLTWCHTVVDSSGLLRCNLSEPTIWVRFNLRFAVRT